jgi:hypothetical protein
MVNIINISHGSNKNAQNYQIIGKEPNCSGYRIQPKQMGITLPIQNLKQKQSLYKVK